MAAVLMGTDIIMAPEASIRHLRLLQLLSPALPVGAFAYSQGLEWAVEVGWVDREEALEDWLADQLWQTLCYVDLPLLIRMMQAVSAEDASALAHWSDEISALRETAELRAEEAARGRALADLLGSLELIKEPVARWRALIGRSQLGAFAYAAATWAIEPAPALLGYAWSWAENLTLAGIKLVPLGQTAGQRILLRLADRIPAAVEHACSLTDAEIGASSPALAIASSRHETQYTRLYRS